MGDHPQATTKIVLVVHDKAALEHYTGTVLSLMAVAGVRVTVFADSKAAARGHDTALTDLWFELIGCIRRHFIRDEASGSHLRSAPPAVVILPADWNIFQSRTSTRAAISRWPSFRGRILDFSTRRRIRGFEEEVDVQ
ncbi:hypothetical protein FOZ63_001190 [Perkinsus olseni]|uniref:Uncharacterized protein n=1 Tax=Perkinsus olseni TaxID=32597 RepID=A0A7J6TUC1_PEROL|nr:hypothetical protein FOZ63_001190 [Perkinsus olseni]